MLIDKVIVEKKHCSKWINDSEIKIIKEINSRVFIETFIGRILVLINYFFMMKLVKTTGGQFLPNYNTESSKYVVLLTWIAFAAMVLVSIVQLIMKSRVYKEDITLGSVKREFYKRKLLNRSVRVFLLIIFYLIVYQIFFQITMVGVDIRETILWWIVILNVSILIYMSLLKFKYGANLKNLNLALDEVVKDIEKGDFKSSKIRINENLEDGEIILNGNDFEITYKAIEELISLAENTEGKSTDSLISKTELITNVSHDLKTPLTSIINYVDFLKQENLDKEDRKDYIDILNRKSKRLKVLIEDLRESTEAEAGKINLECSDINLKEILIQALLENKDKIETSSLDFEFNIAVNEEILKFESNNSVITELDLVLDNEIKNLVVKGDNNIRRVFADPNRMLRVFQNMISNILKYSLKGSKVYIQLEQGESVTLDSGYYTRITFKNLCASEITIKEDELIERFRRCDSSRNTEGSGLGLNIAKGLVEVQGGEFKINIEDKIFSVNIIL